MNARMLKLSVVAAAAALPLLGQAQELARVLSSTPIMQQVASPQQVCNDTQVATPGQKSGAGAVMGALAGGAIGNAVGQGSGRAVATALGLFGGAIAGDKIEGGGQPQVHTVRQCATQTSYQNMVTGYQVVYEYAGKQYSVQMPRDPGPTLMIQVAPVGASTMPPPAAAAPAYMGNTSYLAAPTYIQPTVVNAYPAPYYAPVGVSLNMGYGWGHGHWR